MESSPLLTCGETEAQRWRLFPRGLGEGGSQASERGSPAVTLSQISEHPRDIP